MVSPESILFGDILLIGARHLYFAGILLMLIYAFVLFFFKDIEALSFDQDFARISGIKVQTMNIFLLILIALTVTILVKVVGVVLVLAMLAIPAAIANLFTTRLSTMMLWATIIGLAATMLGIVVSVQYDLPPGASIVIIMGLSFISSLVVRSLTTRLMPYLTR